MYEQLLDEARAAGLTVLERYPFRSPRIRGLYCDGTIALSGQIDTAAERTVILGEELAHAHYSAGDLLRDRRLEQSAREANYDRLIGISGLVRALRAGARTAWEIAEQLGVPEDFLHEALENYKARFGTHTKVTLSGVPYRLTLQPTLFVSRIKQEKESSYEKVSDDL